MTTALAALGRVKMVRQAPLLERLDKAAFNRDVWSIPALKNALREPGTVAQVVFCPKGRPAGYALTERRGAQVWLATLCVVPSLQGQGLGRTLLFAQVQAAARKGARSLYLTVREGNYRAIALYEQSGWQRVKTLINHYPAKGRKPAEDAFVYRLRIV